MNAAIGAATARSSAAISAALHDLAGKRLGVPLYKLWGLDPAAAPLSSFTIAIAPDDDELRASASRRRRSIRCSR